MRIIILGGFLGAGKTTVLLNLARYLVDHTNTTSETPVAILENEVSKNGVDSTMLRSRGFTVSNMFGGCICCTASSFLPYNVKQIQEDYDPDWLIVEATGVARPDTIRAALLDTLDAECDIVAVVDTKRWARVLRAMENLVISQLTDAKVVLLTKIDLVDETIVEETVSQARTYAPEALMLPICATDPYDETLMAQVIGALDTETIEKNLEA